MPFRIRTLNAISQAGLSRLPGDRYLVGHDITQPDALLVRSASLHNQPIDPSVLAVARAGAGTNNIPIAEYSKHGIPVFNTPGANANAVKELVIAGMLGIAHADRAGEPYVPGAAPGEAASGVQAAVSLGGR